jgi:O-glycosyl hydrolase
VNAPVLGLKSKNVSKSASKNVSKSVSKNVSKKSAPKLQETKWTDWCDLLDQYVKEQVRHGNCIVYIFASLNCI